MCGRTLAGCAVLLLVAGCVQPHSVQESGGATTSGVQPSPAAPSTTSAATSVPSPANAAPGPIVQAPPDQPAEKPARVPAPAPASRAAPVTSTSPGGASPAKSAARPPTPAAAAQPAQPAVPAQPALDLRSLEQRLRDTHAIGVFTKLSLKNQVDDLLEQFRAFHHGQSTIALAMLRQHFELLLLKVVSLLQGGDAQLAAAISSSRDALWTVLVDPTKFAQL